MGYRPNPLWREEVERNPPPATVLCVYCDTLDGAGATQIAEIDLAVNSAHRLIVTLGAAVLYASASAKSAGIEETVVPKLI